LIAFSSSFDDNRANAVAEHPVLRRIIARRRSALTSSIILHAPSHNL